MSLDGSGNLHNYVVEGGLLKLQKNGQFLYELVIIVGTVFSNYVR